ncbi:hypothetical protein L0U88_13635 [Flavihumibacter sp. RY-1]|uniref:Uncharacterized protein n=1 Tax=Flavihumibacter fluminis TaxID=2909236 RepID=A0ABS9BLF1_9BACT|nr:hypothetical protein [Flavihumibacter fluminis]MCF1715674.1 hypothetical protein [Flavihumibacter fluminis]
MRTITGIFLLIVFSSNITGLLVVFKLQQLQIRREIKRQIKKGVPENELHLITVKQGQEEQLDWQNEKEFIYKGTFYDVVRKETGAAGTTLYYCINDTQEEELFANLDALIKQYSEKQQSKGKMAKKLLKLAPVVLSRDMPGTELTVVTVDPLQGSYSNQYNSPILAIPAPPPKA